LGDMGSIQRELRPSIQREDQLTMETKLEQIYRDSLRTREMLDGVARIDSARAHDSGRLPF
jgi:hypothetical protein